jgi:hypothetical protein
MYSTTILALFVEFPLLQQMKVESTGILSSCFSKYRMNNRFILVAVYENFHICQALLLKMQVVDNKNDMRGESKNILSGVLPAHYGIIRMIQDKGNPNH